MPDTQSAGPNAGYELFLTDNAGARLYDIVDLVGREAIGELFFFKLRFAEAAKVSGAEPALIGMRSRIVWRHPSGQERAIRGVISRVIKERSDAKYDRFLVDFVPVVWLADQRRRCQVFQEMTAPEIVEKVLQPHISTTSYQRKDYVRRNTCIQYMESDFAFACRLMEEEGIHFFFDHERESQLAIRDHSPANPTLSEPSKLRFSEASGQAEQSGRIYDLETRERMTAPNQRVIDHAYQRKEARFAAEEQTFPGQPDRGGLSANGWGGFLEAYGAVAHRLDEYSESGNRNANYLNNVASAVKTTAQMRAQMRAARFSRTVAHSDYLHLAPGFLFELTGADDADNGAYLITVIEHSHRSPPGGPREWHNQFECLQANVPFRPLLNTARPTIRGTQSAIVVDRMNIGRFTDHYGRVQVRFHWQESNDDNTCWARVAQPWAGDKYGALFTPRPGQEVIVAFQDGDPDQPTIVGGLYNEANPLPFTLPAESSISGFCSRSQGEQSTPGDSSHLYFVDTPGKEQLHIHSQNHAHVGVEHSAIQLVGWGSAESNDKSYLSSAAPARSSIVFGSEQWQAGMVQKVKGVNRHSVFGNQLDIALGTSSEFVVGGWSQANVGVGLQLDLGFRTDVTAGLKVDLHIAPRTIVSVGNQFESNTGKRFIQTAQDQIVQIGGDLIEKIAGNRFTMVAGAVASRLTRKSSGNHQTYDVASFQVHAGEPDWASPDYETMRDAKFNIWRAQLSAQFKDASPASLEILKGAFSEEKVFPLFENPNAVIKASNEILKPLKVKYAIDIVAGYGDVEFADLHPKGKITLFAETINIVGNSIKVLAKTKGRFDGVQAKAKFEAMRYQSQAIGVRPVESLAGLKYKAAETKLKAAATSATTSALVALPVIAASFVAASGIVSVPAADPNEWGL